MVIRVAPEFRELGPGNLRGSNEWDGGPEISTCQRVGDEEIRGVGWCSEDLQRSKS